MDCVTIKFLRKIYDRNTVLNPNTKFVFFFFMFAMDCEAHCSLVLSLFFIFLCSSAARDARDQSPSAVVVGTVYCDTCFHQEFSKFSHLISGASVAVECGDAASGRGYRKVVTTNRRGVFGVRLPPRISKHVHLIEACSVKLLESNEPFCAVASTATAAGLRLKSRRRGVHVYSVGFFSFKPLNEPELCYQKPVLEAEKQEQFAFFLPLPTITFQSSPPQGAGGFPLFQPPTLLPPNPLQPPASVLPPSPSFNLPTTPSSTPPPAWPFPRFPGVPSAFPSKTTSICIRNLALLPRHQHPMEPPTAALFVLLLPLLLGSSTTACYSTIFSFGDSLADTGNLIRVPGQADCQAGWPPYGMTYFHSPTGRFSDGRLIVDFIAEAMGLPLLPPYLEAWRGGRLRKGVNFAVAGATAMDNEFFQEKGITTGSTNSSLRFQIRWFQQLLPSLCASPTDCEDMLQNTLFLMGEIGGNDYNFPLSQGRSLQETQSFVPLVVDTISSGINKLIELGARALLVPGITPLGCNTVYLTTYRSDRAEDYDANGCIRWLNEFSQYHNGHLHDEVRRLQALHPEAVIIYADYYGAMMNIFSDPERFGIEERFLACCGGGGPYNYNSSRPCGSEGQTVCDDTSTYLHWDGLHMTEATYRIVSVGLLQGPFAVPAIATTCPATRFSFTHPSSSTLSSAS
ncbi:unnamed protein product [Musa acuminata var. zebrina]